MIWVIRCPVKPIKFIAVLLLFGLVVIVSALFSMMNVPHMERRMNYTHTKCDNANSTQKIWPHDSLWKKMYPDLHECQTKSLIYSPHKRGAYWVLENYITAELSFGCSESVTLSTQAEAGYLDNLTPLTQHWQGPVSVAVFAPGHDFFQSLMIIHYHRKCGPDTIKRFVTFHLFFTNNHMPNIASINETQFEDIQCEMGVPAIETKYRLENNLTYPINVARNIARVAAQTFFVLPIDIELYPSINFISDFLEMLNRPDMSKSSKPRVYVLPIFEVEHDVAPPNTKNELKGLLRSGKAVNFHKYFCNQCHLIPESQLWIRQRSQSSLTVFHVANRLKPYDKWEPIYVGTNLEPLYDERLSWEGMKDKRVQMLALCLLDYEFHILDNAFLVHHPGIKRKKIGKKVDAQQESRKSHIKKQNILIEQSIIPEYKQIYGVHIGCSV